MAVKGDQSWSAEGCTLNCKQSPAKKSRWKIFTRRSLARTGGTATTAWFALRIGPSTFAIFDVFADGVGRQAHLSGRVAQALNDKADELFANRPSIEKVDVIAVKLPK